MNKLIIFFTALVIFVIIDYFWLKFANPIIYQPELGSLLKAEPNKIAALLLYFFIILGMYFFVLSPAIEQNKSITSVIIAAALYGVVTYSVYDLTSLAVLKGFTAKVAVIDILWGLCINATTAGLTYLFTLRFGLNS